MNKYAGQKVFVAKFLHELAAAEPADMARVLRQYCHEDVLWEAFHPFNTMRGIDQAVATFWRPLKESFPDYDQVLNLSLGGEYEGRDWVSTLGHVCGTSTKPWLGIPATYRLSYLRFGFNVLLHEGKIARAYILLDVVDVMHQAGFYPFRQMPGSPEQWPAPPLGTSSPPDSYDNKAGVRTLKIVREMQMALPKITKGDYQGSPHSPLWHENMNWYGPSGIGSARGKRGFREHHSQLFLQAFPDRTGWPRQPNTPIDAPGHYIRLGDGQFSVTSGWPSVKGTHLGGGWLGLPPSGRHVEMRVADWYRVTPEGAIIENWVAIDIPHIVKQMGHDILGDLAFFANPSQRRWPD